MAFHFSHQDSIAAYDIRPSGAFEEFIPQCCVISCPIISHDTRYLILNVE
jgi:hypothetical protein